MLVSYFEEGARESLTDVVIEILTTLYLRIPLAVLSRQTTPDYFLLLVIPRYLIVAEERLKRDDCLNRRLGKVNRKSNLWMSVFNEDSY